MSKKKQLLPETDLTVGQLKLANPVGKTPIIEKPISKHWRAYLSTFRVGLEDEPHFYKFGKMDVLLTHSRQAGWFIHMKMKRRRPTFDEVIEARIRFVPMTSAMAWISPPADAAGKNAIQLWEIDRAPTLVTDPTGKVLGREIN